MWVPTTVPNLLMSNFQGIICHKIKIHRMHTCISEFIYYKWSEIETYHQYSSVIYEELYLLTYPLMSLFKINQIKIN